MELYGEMHGTLDFLVKKFILSMDSLDQKVKIFFGFSQLKKM
jgi:hypothetical protein